jgi:hypothetical protein
MKQGKLYISFWNICLENLPEGNFTRRRIAPTEAKQWIEQARKEDKLRCYSEDDLLAPYREEQLKKHEELCSTLQKHCKIKLSITDFLHKVDSELWCTNPLNALQLQYPDCLLIINCAYTLQKKTKRGESLSFKTEPSSIEFHTIEEIEHRFIKESFPTLSDKDLELFFAVLDNVPPANERLRKLMEGK